jgi:hypothetical protein
MGTAERCVIDRASIIQFIPSGVSHSQQSDRLPDDTYGVRQDVVLAFAECLRSPHTQKRWPNLNPCEKLVSGRRCASQRPWSDLSPTWCMNIARTVPVALGSVLKPAQTVRLTAYEVRSDEKMDTLRQLLSAETGQTLIFARTKRGAERITKSLARDGFNAAMIHGGRSSSAT